ncbi:phage major capsid protein [Nocardioides salarius]|nr:phage major capsid protein [Nocardioides salarius]
MLRSARYRSTIMNLKEKRAALLSQARGIVDEAKADSRDLTPSQTAEVEGLFKQIEDTDAQIAKAEKSAELVAQLTASGVVDPTQGIPPEPSFDPPAKGTVPARSGGSTWAKSVTVGLAKSAHGMGVKALLTGEITTPPAVTVSPLPAVPTRLLDLVPREGLDQHTFEYLRQVVATNNADVVADNATKPTSVYTFESVEDRARVIAHLSEPFPIRYASDHASVLQVLESQMETGIFEVIERLIVSGTGLGEEWTGILNTSGVEQVAFNTDPLVTLRKARTVQELKGEAITGVAMHPSDIEALDLMREDGATGGFLFTDAVGERIFGPGVRGVPSVAVPVGTAIVGNWSQTRLRIREAAHTLAATQAGDLFDKNQMKLRSEGRFGFQFFRPASMAVVDLTAA